MLFLTLVPNKRPIICITNEALAAYVPSSICITNAGPRTSKYCCELTPAKINKVGSKIKHPQLLCLKSCNKQRQFGMTVLKSKKRCNEWITREKKSFPTFHKTDARTGFRCLALTFVSQETDSATTCLVLWNTIFIPFYIQQTIYQ